MSRTAAPIPFSLQRAPFDVATGLRAGVSRGSLRHAQFEAPFHGVRQVSTQPPNTHTRHTTRGRIVRLAAGYAPLLRVASGECFSHTTALHLYEAPIRTPIELHCTIPDPHGAARGRGVHGHRCADPISAVHANVSETAQPLACVPTITALIQSAALLSFRELVVAADHLLKLRGPPGGKYALATAEEITARAARSHGRGIQRLRAALRVARVGAESRMESLQHFELARMGLDTLELQGVLRDARGNWIGRFDAIDRQKRRRVRRRAAPHRSQAVSTRRGPSQSGATRRVRGQTHALRRLPRTRTARHSASAVRVPQ